MSRSISIELENHFGSGCTTLTTLWELERTDGVILGFTNHDKDIEYGGLTYVAATGFDPSDIAIKSNFSVTNAEIQSILSSESIGEADLLSGKYDYATLDIRLVNFNDLAAGHLSVMGGILSNVSYKDEMFEVEVLGLAERLQKNFTTIISPTCRAIFGDSRCKVDKTPYTLSGTVTTVVSNTTITSVDLVEADDYYTLGEFVWTSGNNSGIKSVVKVYTTGQIELVLPMFYSIEIGDTFDVVAGCNKTFSHCKDKFSNIINFRGEPHVPGQDKMFETSGTFQDS